MSLYVPKTHRLRTVRPLPLVYPLVSLCGRNSYRNPEIRFVLSGRPITCGRCKRIEEASEVEPAPYRGGPKR